MRKSLAMALCALLLLAADPAAAQDKGGDETAAVAAAAQSYVAAFSSPKAMSAGNAVWTPFSIDIANMQVTVLDASKRLARAEATVKRLTAAGWDRSEVSSPVVCVLNRNLAFVSATERRLRKDGSLVGEEGNVSLLAKTPKAGKWSVGLPLHQAR